MCFLNILTRAQTKNMLHFYLDTLHLRGYSMIIRELGSMIKGERLLKTTLEKICPCIVACNRATVFSISI